MGSNIQIEKKGHKRGFHQRHQWINFDKDDKGNISISASVDSTSSLSVELDITNEEVEKLIMFLLENNLTDKNILPEFNGDDIIEIVEKNKAKCDNYKFDWRSYYNGFLDGFATYFIKHKHQRNG